jgi:multimeric flavodoxin WrbA
MSTTLIHALVPGPLVDALTAAVAPTSVHAVRDERFAPCAGCFECWVKTPGRCKAHDAANDVMADIAKSEVHLWVSPVRYGTWHPSAKKALDKCIGLLSPFFQEVYGETHHAARYPTAARMLAVGIFADDAPGEDAALFAELVTREALNLLAPARAVVVVRASDPVEMVVERVREARVRLMASEKRAPPPHVRQPLPGGPGVAPRSDRPRRALFLVGSAKPPGQATSDRLASALGGRLRERGWRVESRHLSAEVHLERPPSLPFLDAAAQSDLVVLSSPIYVDTLPALATLALHQLGDANLPLNVMGMFQCGFPEEEHTWLAPRVLRAAARDHGWKPLGSLTMGGAALWAQPGTLPDHERALDRVADQLDRGEALDEASARAFATPRLSPRIYRWMGDAGWLGQSAWHGTLLHLGDRPFPAE